MTARKGYAINEVVIVVIVIAVLIGLAMPKFSKMIESSRAAEAFANIAEIRNGLERFYASNDRSYTGGCLTSGPLVAAKRYECLMLGNLDETTNSHFTYEVWVSPSAYGVMADRNTHEGGNLGDEVRYEVISGTLIKTGTGAFSFIGS